MSDPGNRFFFHFKRYHYKTFIKDVSNNFLFSKFHKTAVSIRLSTPYWIANNLVSNIIVKPRIGFTIMFISDGGLNGNKFLTTKDINFDLIQIVTFLFFSISWDEFFILWNTFAWVYGTINNYFRNSIYGAGLWHNR